MISIITPTFNRAHLLKETVKSVLAQSYADFEWIIADDGSEDDTEEMLKGFKDERIKYFKLPHTAQLTTIRNFAIAQAKGEYLALLDSDDSWEKDYLSVVLKELESNPNAGYVLSEARIKEGDKIPYPTIYQPYHKQKSPEKYWKEHFTDNIFVIFPSAIMIKKSAFEEAGRFDENLRFGEKDLFTKLAFYFEGVISPEVLVNINRHGANASARVALGTLAEESFKEELITLEHFFDKEFIDEVFYNDISALFHFKLAEFYYRNGYFKQAGKEYRSSLRHNIFQPKGIVKYIISRLR